MTMFPSQHRIYCECQQEHCPHCNPPYGKLIYLDFKYKKIMKLAKALKEKKRLAAEIAQIKSQINSKNSYIKGSNIKEKFDVPLLWDTMISKIQDLVNLKIAINGANKEIQASIYRIGEYKAIIQFLCGLNVNEGPTESYWSENFVDYDVQFDEIKRNELIKEYQDMADRLQDDIDIYNYTTEVAWGSDYDTPKTEE